MATTLSEHQIHLRPARMEDIQILRYWDEQPHVQDSGSEDDWQWETEIKKQYSWRELLLAELDTRPIGFIQIIDPALEETHYWGDVPDNLRAIDIWIGDAHNLGKGYGTIMMRLALERCFQDPRVTAVLIDPLMSNTRAHRFYERIGFEFVEQRVFGNDVCFVYRLDKDRFLSK